jgi:hypothetical protein
MKRLFFALTALISVMFISCEKDNGLISTEDEAIVLNDAAAEASVEAVDYEVDLFTGSDGAILLAGTTNKSTENGPFWGRYKLGQRPVITVEKTNNTFPVTITIDYGTGVELNNGTKLKGKIVIAITAAPRTKGAVRTVTFVDFYVNDIKIEGTRTISFMASLDGIGFTIVGDLLITFPNGTTLERESEKTRLFVQGWDTPADLSDDKFQITGFVSNVSSEGYTFSATITKPLIRLGTCRYIVEGTVAYNRNNKQTGELDYGDGTCDDLATITKDGETKVITLGKWRQIRNN